MTNDKSDRREAYEAMKNIKIKGSVQAIGIKAPLFTALVAAVLLTALRCFQLAKNTDLTTGFFIERDAFVYLFFILAAGASLAVIAMTFLSANMPSHELADGKRPLTAVGSVALAAAFGYESLKMLGEMNSENLYSGLSLYESSIANGTFRNFLEAILGLVAMVAFTALSVACITGTYKWLRFPAVLFLAAPLWGILRVITYFTYTLSYLVAAELFCEMYASIFLMLYLFCLARYFTQTGIEGGSWTVLASGLLSFVFCLLASAPRILVGAAEGFEVDMIFVAGAAFSLASVSGVIRKAVPVNPVEEDNTDIAGDMEIPVEPFTAE